MDEFDEYKNELIKQEKFARFVVKFVLTVFSISNLFMSTTFFVRYLYIKTTFNLIAGLGFLLFSLSFLVARQVFIRKLKSNK